MSRPKPPASASFVTKAIWFVQHRPGRIYAQARNFWTFRWSRLLFSIFPSPGIEFGRNVRVQRYSSLFAEAPTARVRIGDHTLVFERALVEAYGQGSIEIGGDSILSDVRIYSRGRVRIGEGFLGSWGLFLQDFEGHPTDDRLRGLQSQQTCRNFWPSWEKVSTEDLPKLEWDFKPGSIEIGDRVWVGAQCVILKNVKIGSGSIVAAGSVVPAGDYPPHSLIAGNPARVVKTLEPKT